MGMKGRFKNITELSVYASIEGSEEIKKKRLYDKLNEICSSTSRYAMVVAVGD